MKNKIRNIYPGGNTPDGFYSYYNYILPQMEAKKIFYLKGGPGTGKSTMINSIGRYFADRGEAVDFLWCSSDPESLDGVLLKDRSVAVIDGTAPHIMDPENPGAVDRIVDLGMCWNESGIRKNRENIIMCSENAGRLFRYAYGYLKAAKENHIFMSQLLREMISYEDMREYRQQIGLKLDGIALLRRAESRARKDMALGRGSCTGRRKKAFAGAITPMGIKSHLHSIVENMEKIIIINTPIGLKTEELLMPASMRLTDAGFDVEEYYNPMFPENGLEHVICPDASVAVVCVNRYHDVAEENLFGKVIKIDIHEVMTEKDDTIESEILHNLRETAHRELILAVDMLKKAKEQHDMLEQYYIPNMDFDALEKVGKSIVREIEETV